MNTDSHGFPQILSVLIRVNQWLNLLSTQQIKHCFLLTFYERYGKLLKFLR